MLCFSELVDSHSHSPILYLGQGFEIQGHFGRGAIEGKQRVLILLC